MDHAFDNPLTLTELSHVTFILLRSILEDDRQARYIINSNILKISLQDGYCCPLYNHQCKNLQCSKND